MLTQRASGGSTDAAGRLHQSLCGLLAVPQPASLAKQGALQAAWAPIVAARRLRQRQRQISAPSPSPSRAATLATSRSPTAWLALPSPLQHQSSCSRQDGVQALHTGAGAGAGGAVRRPASGLCPAGRRFSRRRVRPWLHQDSKRCARASRAPRGGRRLQAAAPPQHGTWGRASLLAGPTRRSLCADGWLPVCNCLYPLQFPLPLLWCRRRRRRRRLRSCAPAAHPPPLSNRPALNPSPCPGRCVDQHCNEHLSTTYSPHDPFDARRPLRGPALQRVPVHGLERVAPAGDGRRPVHPSRLQQRAGGPAAPPRGHPVSRAGAGPGQHTPLPPESRRSAQRLGDCCSAPLPPPTCCPPQDAVRAMFADAARRGLRVVRFFAAADNGGETLMASPSEPPLPLGGAAARRCYHHASLIRWRGPHPKRPLLAALASVATRLPALPLALLLPTPPIPAAAFNEGLARGLDFVLDEAGKAGEQCFLIRSTAAYASWLSGRARGLDCVLERVLEHGGCGALAGGAALLLVRAAGRPHLKVHDSDPPCPRQASRSPWSCSTSGTTTACRCSKSGARVQPHPSLSSASLRRAAAGPPLPACRLRPPTARHAVRDAAPRAAARPAQVRDGGRQPHPQPHARPAPRRRPQRHGAAAGPVRCAPGGRHRASITSASIGQHHEAGRLGPCHSHRVARRAWRAGCRCGRLFVHCAHAPPPPPPQPQHPTLPPPQADWYLRADCRQQVKAYYSALASRVNTLNGRTCRDDPTILSCVLCSVRAHGLGPGPGHCRRCGASNQQPLLSRSRLPPPPPPATPLVRPPASLPARPRPLQLQPHQ